MSWALEHHGQGRRAWSARFSQPLVRHTDVLSWLHTVDLYTPQHWLVGTKGRGSRLASYPDHPAPHPSPHHTTSHTASKHLIMLSWYSHHPRVLSTLWKRNSLIFPWESSKIPWEIPNWRKPSLSQTPWVFLDFLCFSQIPWLFPDWKIGNSFSRFSLISRVAGNPAPTRHNYPPFPW